MDRRDFVQHIATLTLGAGIAGLDIALLIALLPHAEPTGTRHLGTADIEAIEQATTTFERQDFAQGSGLAHDSAVAHLRATLPLLTAQTTPEVRPRLLVATAYLATIAGWMSFDANQHDAARRLWLIGLNIARATDHPRGSDLTVYLLYDMALQAVHLGRPDEALRLVHLGHAAGAGPHPVSASTRCCLAKIQARAHAAQGDAADCERALSLAAEQFSTVDPASCPPWGSFHDEALLAAQQGTAITTGHQAIDAVTALHSPRAYDRLRILNTALQPLHTSAGVAELGDRLSTTAA